MHTTTDNVSIQKLPLTEIQPAALVQIQSHQRRACFAHLPMFYCTSIQKVDTRCHIHITHPQQHHTLWGVTHLV